MGGRVRLLRRGAGRGRWWRSRGSRRRRRLCLIRDGGGWGGHFEACWLVDRGLYRNEMQCVIAYGRALCQRRTRLELWVAMVLLMW